MRSRRASSNWIWIATGWRLFLTVVFVLELLVWKSCRCSCCYSFPLIAENSYRRLGRPLLVFPRTLRNTRQWAEATTKATAETAATQQSNVAVEDHNDVKWNVMFDKLVEYKNLHQTCKVPRKYRCDDGTMLGIWVRDQRYIAKKDKIRLDRRERLDSIGFVWQALERRLVNNTHVSADDRFNANWDVWLQLLIEYKQVYGNCRVPQRYCCENGMKLGDWVSKQRKTGSSDKRMNPIRRNTLDSIGFVWKVQEHKRSKKLDKQWNDMFERLQEYHAVHNDCLVPNLYMTKDGKALGKWVSRQRGRIAAGKMDPDRLQNLQSLGFVVRALPDESIDARWNRLFQQLVEYQKQHGDYQVPKNYPADPVLGHFVFNLRRARHELPEDRRAKLDSIGFVWNSKESRWYSSFTELKEFQRDKGHLLVSNKQNPKLYQWVYCQRKKRRRHKLDMKQIELLDSVGFNWDCATKDSKQTIVE